jgi:cell division protein FtsA
VISRTKYIGAVEIGTSKVTVVVGEYSGKELAIISRAEVPARGIIKGAVVDYRAASDCTKSRSAVDSARRP